tara:strand:+ start:4532 stop:4732 length:201 start_codon:yes stop_codon:yes gene_type:complete
LRRGTFGLLLPFPDAEERPLNPGETEYAEPSEFAPLAGRCGAEADSFPPLTITFVEVVELLDDFLF